ncbi:MAG: MFS transporter [Nitrospinaceae bacterium]|jgi:MFS transporter, OPA family, glycerol-3-phosphate transporter|nr:MFS transporter [Nitrospinaceae bacterium]MBT3432323.1 MFS transporter [Nitrospinaceae bacterium]MBT3822231.1 MFS transporter [Nitrospinaceae bacterium]MBT4430811.1 MFS transporter [Nitrospinaceae bacterium]MBT5369036.1 MFS transporter [Nitrospinaceae bacterium]
MSDAPSQQVRYEELPELYHTWKWRVLIAYCVFYSMNYMGRFNFSLIQPAIIEDMGITSADTGWINSWMFWGFAFGDFVHGHLAERFGYRRILLLGALGTGLFNYIASFGTTINGLLVPWAIVGFVNAATWAPGIGIIAQWWGRRERGRAMGLVGTAAGFAMLVVWVVTPWVAGNFGWRAALRYPPMIISLLGVAFYFVARDKPRDVGLPEYAESDEVSLQAEAASAGREHGLHAYIHLLSNWRFFIACQVKGLDNVVRYGIVSWAPVYYAQVGGMDLREMGWVTFAYPLGYMWGPICGGYISDKFFASNRSRVIILAGFLSGAAVLGIALIPANSIPLAVLFLIVGGFFVNMSPIQALAVDLAGRRLAGTASGVLDAHGYIYGALQAWFFGWLAVSVPNGWLWVFSIMAATRLISVAAIWRVRA